MKTATMKKARLLTVLLAVVMTLAIFGVLSLTVNAAEAADDLTVTMGTESVVLKDTDEDGFYEIDSAEKLYAFAAAVNGGNATINGELTQDITVNTNVLAVALNDQSTDGIRVWTPIGEDHNSPFKGSFNGNGYSVSGLYYEDTGAIYIGLFGYVTKNTAGDNTIANVGVKDSYFLANRYVGAVVGHSAVDVVNCYNDGSAVFGNRDSVGGVVGYNMGTITNCYNTGAVSGDNHIGGIVGDNAGVVTKCYNVGTVEGNNGVGGITGLNNGTVTVCYNTGAVKATIYVGGIVGDNYGKVISCYNTGNVDCKEEDAFIGGIVGGNYKNSEVKDCYYLEGCVDSANATDKGTPKNAKAFKSGEVTYLLNGAVSEGALNWYQLITVPGVTGEKLPQFVDNRYVVYYHPREAGSDYEYSNHDHDWKFEVVNGNILHVTCQNNADGKCHWNGGDGGYLTLVTASKYYNSYVAEVFYTYSDAWYFEKTPLAINFYDADGNLLSMAPVNVGDYKAELTYGSYTLSRTYSIFRSSIIDDNVSIPDDTDMFYNGNAHDMIVTVRKGGLDLVKDRDYTLKFYRDGVETDDFTSAGTITIVVEGINNFIDTVEKTYVIGYPEIEDDDVFVSPDTIFNTLSQKPVINIVVDGLTLVQDTDYKVTFMKDGAETNDFTNAGTITIIVEGINNYVGKVEKTYVIEQAEFTDSDVEISFNEVIYNGSVQEPEIVVTVNGVKLEYYVDYSYAFLRNDNLTSDRTNVGVISIIVKGMQDGNYTGWVEKTYEIKRAVITEPDVTISPDVIFNGTRQEPTIGVTVDGLTLVKGTDYTVKFYRDGVETDNFTMAGEIIAVIEGIGNYTGTVEKTYTIERAEITGSDVTVSPDVIFNGQPQAPEIGVVVGGLTLVKDSDYTVKFYRDGVETDNFTMAGKIIAVIEGIGNYIGTVVKEYTINPAEITDSDVTISPDVVYNGSVQKPITTVKVDGLTLVEGTDFTVTYLRNGVATTDFINEGTITVIVTGIGNYKGTITNEYAIKRAAINLDDVTISPDTIYNTFEQKPTISIVIGGLTLVQDIDYTVKFERNGVETTDFTNAGIITVVIEGTNNYFGTVEKTYTIKKAQLSLSLSSPVTVVCPGNKIVLAVTSNSSELPAPIFNNGMFSGAMISGNADELLITVSEDFVFGFQNEYKITIIVTYEETDNYFGNSASITLKVRACGDCEEALAALDKALADLEAAMNSNDKILANQILALDTALKNAIEALENADATNRGELVNKIEKADAALANAIAAVQDNLDKAVSDLNNAIANGDKALAEEIADLKAALDAAKATHAKDVADLTAKIEAADKALADAIAAVQDNLDKAVSDLNNAIANGDKALADAIAALDKALAEAKATHATDVADLTAKIEAAKTALNAAIEELKGRVTAVEKDIADIFTLLEASGIDIGKINTTLGKINTSLEALVKADEALGGQLSEAINNAKSELNAAKAELKALIDAVQTNLDKAVEDLNKAIANGDKVLDDKIAALDKALADAKAALEATHAADVKALTEKIETADAALDAAIKAVQKNLDDAKAELNAAIANGDKALNDKITALNKALADAKAALEATGAADKTELVSKIETANAALEAAIAAVQKNLDDAKAELNAAIANGDKALDDKITALNAALDAAKAALEATDAADKAELVSKIETADAALDAAIKAVQKNLDDAKTELNAAIANGDKALDDKIAALNAALDAAKAALEATDAAAKAELVSKIEAADAALQAAIDALSAELGNVKNELENLKNELANLKNELSNAKTEIETTKTEGEKSDNQVQTVATVAAVTSGVTLVSGAAAAIWLLISKKRLF